MQFKEVLKDSIQWNYPHIVAKYAYELTKIFNSFYTNVRVNDEEDDMKKSLRILLVKSFSQTLKETFALLWIDMPEKM
jgi:arginyl-tRNA synthetase